MNLAVSIRRTWVIAQGFIGESIRQPSYYVLIVSFSLLALVSWLVLDSPYGMGSGGIILIETAIGSLTLLGLLILLTIGTNVFQEEIRKRTIVTLLSKPIGSTELVLGKFVGIAVLLLPAYAVVGLVFTFGIWSIESQLDYGILGSGVLLSYVQVLMLAAAGLAVSVHLSLVATAGVVVALFAAGNLLPFIKTQLESSGFLTHAMLNGSSFLVPDLNLFDLTRAASLGIPIPVSYLSTSFLYAVLYSGAALLAAIWLLNRREVY